MLWYATFFLDRRVCMAPLRKTVWLHLSQLSTSVLSPTPSFHLPSSFFREKLDLDESGTVSLRELNSGLKKLQLKRPIQLSQVWVRVGVGQTQVWVRVNRQARRP